MQHYTIRFSLLATAVSVGFASAAQAAPPVDSAYSTDPQSSYVEDATSKGIGQVNMITCIMAAMKPDVLVNEDAYAALVDQPECDPEARSSTSNSGGGDASQAAQYTTATVLSTRASNDDPMIMKTWLNESEDGMDATIFVHNSVSAEASTLNPYGEFRLDFCAKADGGTSCMTKGFLEGGDGTLSFFQDEGGDDNSSVTALSLASIGTTSGSGELRVTRTEGEDEETQQMLFAYDADHFLRDDQCFSRDAADPETGLSVWRYGLYDSITGDRIERDSGFPFEYISGGETYHGHIGYWGLSLQPEATGGIADGDTLQRVEHDADGEPTATDYTAVLAPGKLMKYTKQSRTLAELDEIRFNTWVGDVTGFFAGAEPQTQYVMYWDQADAALKVTGRMNCDENGCQTQDLEAEQSVDLSFWSAQGGIQGHSEALGGQLFIDLQGVASPVDAAAVNVVNRVEELVYPDEMPSTLYCLRDCPTSVTLESFFAEGSVEASPYVPASYNLWAPTTNVVTYAIDVGTGVLKDAGGSEVAFTDAEGYAAKPSYQRGVRTGRLFTSLADAQCEEGSTDYCDHKIGTLDSYYEWETGPNNWNRFAGVKDATGDLVRFEAPLRLDFAVPDDETRYHAYAGKSIVLEYGGFGDLWGIPGICVSHISNEQVSCDSENARYVPEFVIPFDAELGRATIGDEAYLVKWLDREIRFARKDLGACSALSLPADVELPVAGDVMDPTDPASDTYIGVEPQVDAAPRVIHGTVVY